MVPHFDGDAPYLGTHVSAGKIVPLIRSGVAGPLGLATVDEVDDWNLLHAALSKRGSEIAVPITGIRAFSASAAAQEATP